MVPESLDIEDLVVLRRGEGSVDDMERGWGWDLVAWEGVTPGGNWDGSGRGPFSAALNSPETCHRISLGAFGVTPYDSPVSNTRFTPPTKKSPADL
ncbi:hypothetical protein NC651_014371 [Populus alba x Populus x berolinensis]|nr:hypothetical protein NC651_014371 [Populus alba x Populus x berolinensis]